MLEGLNTAYEIFANFLFQDKKLGGLGCNPKNKNSQFLLSLFASPKSNQKGAHEYQIRPDSSHEANRHWGRISRISHHSWTPTAPESFKHNLLI
jgi:hypothetical protein